MAGNVAESATWPLNRGSSDHAVSLILSCIVSAVEAATVISLPDIQEHAFVQPSQEKIMERSVRFKSCLNSVTA